MKGRDWDIYFKLLMTEHNDKLPGINSPELEVYNKAVEAYNKAEKACNEALEAYLFKYSNDIKKLHKEVK